MTAIGTREALTSAVGCMYPSSPDATSAVVLTATTLPAPATASTYEAPRLIERTAAGPSGESRSVQAPERQRIPLSSAARDMRRPQVPVLLLEAEQKRPDIPAKARTVRPRRTPRTAG